MRPKPKLKWHIQAISPQKGNYSTAQELTPSRKWLQCLCSLSMTATNCRTLPCWSSSACSALSPPLEALGQLLFDTTTPYPSHPLVRGYSWFADKLDRSVLVCTITALAFCKPSFVPSPAIFPNSKYHRKLAFETQNKTLHLFWVLPLCWSLAWLHNSLLKPFCSNICRELCKVISVHCQASLRFTLALTPSVKIRQCFTAWVNPYRCPCLSGTKTTLMLMWHGCLDWDSQGLVSDEDLKGVCLTKAQREL